MKRSLLMLCASFLLCATACTDDNNENNNNGNNSSKSYDTAEDVFAEADKILAQGFCKQVFECPERAGASFLLVFGRYANQADCVANFSLTSYEENLAAVSAGRVKYDKATAAACVSKIRSTFVDNACKVNQRNDEPAECEKLFTGTVAADGKCNTSDECAGDLSCQRDNNSNDCFGTCKANTTECGDATCDAGQYCDTSADPVCAALKKEGEMCDFNARCADDLSCLTDDTFKGTCIKEYSLEGGSACNSDSQCKEGLECGRDSKKCAAPSDNLKLLASGEACDLDPEESACTPGLSCQNFDFTTQKGTCGTPLGENAECFITFECAPQFFCSNADLMTMTKGVCAPLLADGVDCKQSTDCESNNCDDQTNKCVGDMICKF